MGDLEFLKEMKDRLDKSQTDPSQFEYVNQMIKDWIDELEIKNSHDSI